MKKNLFKIAAMLFVCFCCAGLLSSCGDDKDEPSGKNLQEQLQGTWVFSKMKVSLMGQTVEMDRDDIVDGSGYNEFYDDVLTFSGDKVNGLKYSIDGNKILLPWYEEQQWWAKVSFSGSTMVLNCNVVEEGIEMQMWITYVKSGSRSAVLPSVVDGSCTTLVSRFMEMNRK